MKRDDTIIKYPRTPHIQGSHLQPGDENLHQRPFSDIAGRNVVLEEKIDGANSAVSFTDDGELRLQSRGHFLTGGYRERHYDLMKQWGAVHKDLLYEVLGKRYIMYGEWMYAKHSIYYDLLPHYFNSSYISARHIDHVREDAEKMGLDADLVCRETDSSRTMEGIYIKVEENGEVVDRMKYVRASFLQTVEESPSHWLDRPIVPNRITKNIEDLFL